MVYDSRWSFLDVKAIWVQMFSTEGQQANDANNKSKVKLASCHTSDVSRISNRPYRSLSGLKWK